MQKPFSLGVDFVLYSTTKYLNGHGNSIAGAIIFKSKEYAHPIWDTMKLLGTNSNPWDAWLLYNGLKTLSVRLDKHCQNAMEIARYLEQHEKVKRVNYPGLTNFHGNAIAQKQMSQFGGMLSFEISPPGKNFV